MRAFVFIVPIFLATTVFGQLGQPVVTQVGDLTITKFGFNSPAVPPGQFAGGNVVGVFDPGPSPSAYFSEPIPDGGPQVGFTAPGATIEIASGTLDTNAHVFSVDIGTALAFPTAGFDLFISVPGGPGGPRKFAEVTSSDVFIPPGSFRQISVGIGPAGPAQTGAYSIFLTTPPFPPTLPPAVTLLDNAELIDGPADQVPEPSTPALVAVAAIGLTRRGRATAR